MNTGVARRDEDLRDCRALKRDSAFRSMERGCRGGKVRSEVRNLRACRGLLASSRGHFVDLCAGIRNAARPRRLDFALADFAGGASSCGSLHSHSSDRSSAGSQDGVPACGLHYRARGGRWRTVRAAGNTRLLLRRKLARLAGACGIPACRLPKTGAVRQDRQIGGGSPRRASAMERSGHCADCRQGDSVRVRLPVRPY